MPYRVRLENFEGPLDLLLFLIKKNEIDIYDIPIAELTRQYLEYIEIIQILDLESAGDFLILAATLLHIKSQMLLPKPQLDDDEDEIIDPRMELVTKLLEYKRFKEIAYKFRDYEAENLEMFPKAYFEYQNDDEEDQDYGFHDVSLFTLIQAFKSVLDNIPKITYHEVHDIEISTEQQIDFVLNYLDKNPKTSFIELITQLKEKIVIIVTFIAVLELIKRRQIIVKQAIPFGEIWIQKT